MNSKKCLSFKTVVLLAGMGNQRKISPTIKCRQIYFVFSFRQLTFSYQRIDSELREDRSGGGWIFSDLESSSFILQLEKLEQRGFYSRC